MDYFSIKADRDREERKETKSYLFMTIYSMDRPEKLLGMTVGRTRKY